MNFSDIGTSSLKDANAFKKIQYFSKTNPQSLFTSTSDFQTKYTKVANLYINDFTPNNTPSYGTFRQHNYTSSAAITNTGTTLLDPMSLDKYLDYNLGLSNKQNIDSPSTNHALTGRSNELNGTNTNYLTTALSPTTTVADQGVKRLATYPEVTSFIDSESDAKSTRDPLKYLLNTK
jgi:hypothetical protein